MYEFPKTPQYMYGGVFIMETEKYYVNIASGEISQNLVGNNNSFTIYATTDELRTLRTLMSGMHEGSMDSHWRSFVPFVPYHHDAGNDRYDRNLSEVYQFLYDHGDDDAKSHIETHELLLNRDERE